MVEKSKKIWLDGKFVDWDEAHVHILTHTLHYGVGLFEGIRCYQTANGTSAIFRLTEHVARMLRGARIVQLDSPFLAEELMRACVEIVRVNNLKECYIRPVLFAGDGAMGVYADNPIRVAIAVWTWGEYLGHGALERGIRAKVSSFVRHHMNAGMSQGKISGQYSNAVLAKREAVKLGYDEAIMLDPQGLVCEGPGENIFAIQDGVIRTPNFAVPILPGITRDAVLTIARNEGLDVREENFSRDFLYACDEVFFTGTAAEVTPIREIDNRTIGTGVPGPITRRLQGIFADVVRGKMERYTSWLTRV